jgi:peptide/nickel transport system permease protein
MTMPENNLEQKRKEISDGLSVKRQTQGDVIWYQFKRNKMAVAGLIFLVFMSLVAIFAYNLVPYDPLKMDPAYAMGTPKPPSWLHIFGTDDLGRDEFSRAVSASQVSMSVGFVAVGISTIIGILVGSIAGFAGGWADNLLMRLADIFLSLPTFFLILTVNTFLKPSIYNIMVIIGIFGWMGISRLVRGEFLRLQNMDFITAARSVGVPNSRMILRHFLPNAIAPVIVSATLGIPSAILLESSLSFLGLGVPAPLASWGNMLYDGRTWMDMAWWMWVPPGILISITVIAFNFVGDGLRDAFDPTQRGR